MSIRPDLARERARLAAVTKHHGPDHPYTVEARRQLRFARLREQIAETVAEAPPLTLDQVHELRALLAGKR